MNRQIIFFMLLSVVGLAHAETLLEAVQANNLNRVKELLQDQHATIGINRTYPSDNNRTVLMIAAHKGYVEIVKQLIQAHANLNLIDSQGKTAIELAGNYQTHKALDDAGALTEAEVRKQKK